MNGESESGSAPLIFGAEAGSNAVVNGEERRLGGISDHNKKFVGSNMGDAIAVANTFLELNSNTLKRAIGSEGPFDIAKRFEIGEVTAGGSGRSREKERRAASGWKSRSPGRRLSRFVTKKSSRVRPAPAHRERNVTPASVKPDSARRTRRRGETMIAPHRK